MTVTLEKSVRDFVSAPHQLFIDGDRVDSVLGRTFATPDPATGETLAWVAEAGTEDVDLAVRAARRAFTGPWSRMTPAQRGHVIWRIGDLILEHAERLAQLETLDNGKALAVARAADIPAAAALFHYMAGWATKIEGSTIPLSVPGAGFHAYTLREPVGVVGQIIPWNFPLLMAAWKVAPALATGNVVVLKPAEQTPLSALYLAELIAEAGAPDGVVNVIPGYGEIAGAALAAHEDVDKVAFTGSTEVGKMIVQAAAGNLKKLTLELGGKSPNVVFDDADLTVAIPAAASAIFFNHGQCCSAGSRLYVQESRFDEVVDGVADIARHIRVGPGMEPGTEMGPLISDEQLRRVTGYLESGRAEGAETRAGGRRCGDRGYFLEPTVLTGTRRDMKVVREEIFGPVLVASPFSELDEIAAEANDTPYGLAAGVWTRDLAKAQALAGKIRAGTVWINCYNVFDPALPFGGYKQSGWGREMGHAVLDAYTEVKSVCVQL
ncbi:aldehyde dehydrogenase family protein [Microbispora sp. RL4-1S]|uniref:Aldehyde dehydrogenase family protein n=1 Tax=Microbispora oryzae TaxID=2806554 RepID=A0A941AQD5_9ACTN|nr:aldehyde dehydrogenase family protein [Microbispora oryzae]MBP2704609.1 aldehyde dehydrogenase family protein [Microbispora oryzae]